MNTRYPKQLLLLLATGAVALFVASVSISAPSGAAAAKTVDQSGNQGGVNVNVPGSGNTININQGISAEELNKIIQALQKDQAPATREQTRSLEEILAQLLKSQDAERKPVAQALRKGDTNKATQLLEALRQKQLSAQRQQNQALALTNVELAALYNWSKPDQALSLLQQATQLDPHNLRALNQLGALNMRLGKMPEAIKAFEQALNIARATNHRQGEGSLLGNLGLAYLSLGEFQKAISYFGQALKISRDIGDRSVEGASLNDLGSAYLRLGEYKKAISYFEQALNIARDIGNRQGEGANLGNLGLAYFSLGEYKKAIGYHEQALKISRDIGDRQGEGISLGNLGGAYFRLGEVQKAISYYEQALKIAREIGDRQGEGNRLGNLGLAYESLGDLQKAIGYMEQALQIFVAIESPNAEKARKNLARLKAKR